MKLFCCHQPHSGPWNATLGNVLLLNEQYHCYSVPEGSNGTEAHLSIMKKNITTVIYSTVVNLLPGDTALFADSGTLPFQ